MSTNDNVITIASAIITEMPKNIFDKMPEVIATFTDDSVKTLFSYYPDEISFSPSEFIGLTEDEARQLRHKKDVRYLQS